MEEIELKDLVKILWNRRLVLFIIPIFFAMAAFLYSKTTTPTYISTVKIDIGSIGSQTPEDNQNAQQLLSSREFLDTITNRLRLSSIESLKQSLTIKAVGSRVISIETKFSNAETAKRVADEIAGEFLKQRETAIKDKKFPIDDLIDSYQKQYEMIEQERKQKSDVQLRVEANNNLSSTEKELASIHLADSISRDQIILMELSAKVKEAQLELVKYQPAKIIEPPNVPAAPVFPQSSKLTTIAIGAGILTAIFMAFMIEYFTSARNRSRLPRNMYE